MAFITEPTVRLVSRTEVNWEAVSAFLEQEGVPPVPESIRAGDDESAAVVEISARVCYMSYGKGRRDIEEFITNLLSKGDGSVFEHVNYGFMMTGVSRALTHELVRHRAGFAYSQRSQRFVNESDADFVIPPALAADRPGTEKARGILEDAIEDAQEKYRNLVSELYKALPVDEFEAQTDRRKAVRQAARAVPAQRDRDEDLRHGQRARVASLHRDARRGLRRLGDTQGRAHGPRHPQGRGPAAVRRLYDQRPAGRHTDSKGEILEGLRSRPRNFLRRVGRVVYLVVEGGFSSRPRSSRFSVSMKSVNAERLRSSSSRRGRGSSDFGPVGMMALPVSSSISTPALVDDLVDGVDGGLGSDCEGDRVAGARVDLHRAPVHLQNDLCVEGVVRKVGHDDVVDCRPERCDHGAQKVVRHRPGRAELLKLHGYGVGFGRANPDRQIPI